MTPFLRTDTVLACAGLLAGVLTMTPLAASAQDAPLSHVANPGIYKVIDENSQFRVVLATWQPGQRDALHSHPVNATYALTACDFQLYGRDGSPLFNGHRNQGTSGLQDHIAAHSFENVGKSDCQILIVERK
jgi:hypothetical protein